MKVVEVGSGAVLVEVNDSREALSLAGHLRAAAVPADEIVPGACTVLIDGLIDGLIDEVREGTDGRAAVERALGSWQPGASVVVGELVEIPVAYDGADLDVVAGHWGVSVADVVERHQRLEFTSAFCGFAPGFAYLAGLPQDWAVPRRRDPRTRVPAGSVALADAWCGVYPTASPGGWQLLGHTELTLWDPASQRPALLAPGTRVRFVAR